MVDKPTKHIHKGYVMLYGTYLTDSDIVEIARVSTGSGARGEKDDKPFIDYLYRHEHMSPFGFPQMTFKIKAPIFVVRQLFRHRMAQVNELSGRYAEMPEEMFIPSSVRIAFQGKDNRQGSGEPLKPEEAAFLLRVMESEQASARACYEQYIGEGVSKEVARINLPLSQYTVFFWQQDLRNLLHMLKLRMDHHAQPEIQEYARIMYDFAKEAFPWTVEAFEKHTLWGRRFSRDEIEILRELLEMNESWEWVKERVSGWRKSHAREFFVKLWMD